MEEEILGKIKSLIEENKDMRKMINCYDYQLFGGKCGGKKRTSFCRFAIKMLQKHWFHTVLLAWVALFIALMCR